MTVLPAMFFFGLPEMGRGCVNNWLKFMPTYSVIQGRWNSSTRLLMVLALGVYCSSVVKDLICSPRPFAPLVTRLSLSRFFFSSQETFLTLAFRSDRNTSSWIRISIYTFYELRFYCTVFLLPSSPSSFHTCHVTQRRYSHLCSEQLYGSLIQW